jgi:hypothetical protein
VARLFISQERIDRWLGEGKARIDGETMSMPALGKSFRLQPAVHFLRLVSEGTDVSFLVGRVKTQAQVKEMGGEVYATSVVLGESAYEVESGFVGEVTGPASSSGAAPILPAE